MQSSIHHQAGKAESLHLQTTQVAIRIVCVPALLPCQALGVERPALGVGIESKHVAEEGQVKLAGEAELVVMAGDALVVSQGGHLEARLGALQGGIKDAGPRAIQGGGGIESRVPG